MSKPTPCPCLLFNHQDSDDKKKIEREFVEGDSFFLPQVFLVRMERGRWCVPEQRSLVVK